MANGRDFNDRLKKLGERIRHNARETLKATAFAIDQALVTSTPVDTGRARSNWIVSLGSPTNEVVETYGPGGASTQGALGQARDTLAGYTDGSVYISNNVDYIGALNDGSSAQAPAGFIELAIETGVATVKKAQLLAE